MQREIIHTSAVYTSRSHLSQAARWGDLVWTGGLGPLDVAGNIISDDIAAQARQCLENLHAVLRTAGSDLNHVLKVNVYLRQIEDFAAFEAVYKTFFTDTPPPRCVIACSLGHPASEGRPGMAIEIEAVAGVPAATAEETV